MAIKRFAYILLPVLSFFLMSHNAFAEVQLTQDVYLVRGNFQTTLANYSTTNNSCLGVSNALWLVNNCTDQNVFFSFLRVNIPNMDYHTGYFLTMDLYLYNNNNDNSLDAWMSGLRVASGSENWIDLVDTTYEQLSDSSGVVHLTFRAYTLATHSTLDLNFRNENFLKLYNGDRLAFGTATVWNTRSASNYTADIQSAVTAINNLNSTLNTMSGKLNNLGTIADRQNVTNQKLDQLYQQQQQEQAKEDQAIDNIEDQTASDITGTDNQNTTNLIGLFSSFVTAMGNASSTNCNFDGDFGNLDLGQMNFCRDNPPAIVQVIGSLVLIAVFVPLAYFLVNRIIAEVRSFTNG